MENQTNALPAYITVAADGSVDITTRKPVNIGGAETSVVRMREPTVEDMERHGNITNPQTRELAIFADLCSMSPAEVRALKWGDYNRLQTAYSTFID